ncbi:MAG: T9SS C-terminal target domain-containing protein, partial [Methanothrix sp.]
NLQKLPDNYGDVFLRLAPQFYGDTLRLDHNRLRYIPSSISKYYAMTGLHLENNLLDSIPSEIVELTGLRELFIDSNNIKYLPASLANANAWLYISANHNQITTIPDEYLNAYMVTKIDANYNFICAQTNTIRLLVYQNKLSINNQICTTIESQPSLLKPSTIYPNPFSGSTFIRTDGLTKIFDLSGRLVLQTSKNTVFNALPGVYILKSNGNIKKVVSIK